MSSSPSAGQGESPLTKLQNKLGCSWKNIEDARKNTDATLENLAAIIGGESGEYTNVGSDTSVVVHGSLARRECTRGSDLDWTLLVDGVADASVQRTFLDIKNALSDADFGTLGLKPPGREGTFGALTFSQPIMHFIGGEEDSNSNTTRRVLLLLEAVPVGERRDAFDRVRNGILRRYLDEDRGLLREGHIEKNMRWIPLFLLNDFARYWRTMAVDFAYKQFDRGNRGYALRSIKLGTSRKLLYASGLLACFWCDPAISRNEMQVAKKQSVIASLGEFLSLTPLERVAQFFQANIGTAESVFLRTTAVSLFSAYDEFLSLLNDQEKRLHLEQLKPADEEDDSVFKEARTIRRTFRLAIQDMFLGEGSPLQKLSIEKGVF
jgi:hypothetical protein